MSRTASVPLVAALSVLFCCTAWTPGRSLAELAKKEKERRAQTPSKVHVLSNADVAKFQKGAVTTGVYGEVAEKTISVQPLGATPSPAGAAPAGTAPGTAPVTGVPAAPGGKDEAYWRNRLKELSEKVSGIENKSVLAQLQVNELKNQFFREQDGFYREKIQKDTDAKLQEIQNLGEQLKAAQKELEDFKKEARRNNIPVGWVR